MLKRVVFYFCCNLLHQCSKESVCNFLCLINCLRYRRVFFASCRLISLVCRLHYLHFLEQKIEMQIYTSIWNMSDMSKKLNAKLKLNDITSIFRLLEILLNCRTVAIWQKKIIPGQQVYMYIAVYV